ncbi:response regulator transcription factor [Aliiglaciecola sp. CAU 1673]|uniref:response regulator transcription factor n=1 Tax=Aliiglaciecola sp. CAU 1673 TaxID=3032595 RepID=UPI0023DC9B39|nr:response regulator transcription factor [Aliiglaciecola sp. CAU 1673]MDF2177265.1 response regulator transcription factor [Aliiglaciecola sp. CAU 1673]
MRLLLIEDDRQLAVALQRALRAQGYAVDHVGTAKEALLSLKVGMVDAAILDLGLPDMDGTELLRKLRSEKNRTPILVLTARDSISDKIHGLDLGADDYLAKPFDMEELLARLRVIERRLGTAQSACINIGPVSLDTAAHSLSVNGENLSLARKEYMLVKILMENAGRVQSREQLETKLYEWGEEVASNAVEVHIHHLRKKLPEGFIQTIRGVGYTIAKG